MTNKDSQKTDIDLQNTHQPDQLKMSLLERECTELDREEEILKTYGFDQSQGEEYLRKLTQFVAQDFSQFLDLKPEQFSRIFHKLCIRFINQNREDTKMIIYAKTLQNILNQAQEKPESSLYLLPFFTLLQANRKTRFQEITELLDIHLKKITLRLSKSQRQAPVKLLLADNNEPKTRKTELKKYKNELLKITQESSTQTEIDSTHLEVIKTVVFCDQNPLIIPTTLVRNMIEDEQNETDFKHQLAIAFFELVPIKYRYSDLITNLCRDRIEMKPPKKHFFRKKERDIINLTGSVTILKQWLTLLTIDDNNHHYGFIDLISNIGVKEVIKLLIFLVLCYPNLSLLRVLEKKLQGIILHYHPETLWLTPLIDTYNLATCWYIHGLKHQVNVDKLESILSENRRNEKKTLGSLLQYNFYP